MATKKKMSAKAVTVALPKFRIEVDARTASMPDAALECRSVNHPWERVPSTDDRRALLAGEGMTETVRVCVRCGSERHELYFLPSYDEVRRPVYVWSANYLISKEHAGTGRLSKQAVKKAQFARENADLVELAA